MSQSFVEPLLAADENCYVMFPVKYDDVWSLYKKQIDSFWRVEEINFTADIAHFAKLNPDEKEFISMILAFFAASDGIVAENLVSRFSSEISNSEIRAFYAFQNMMENIHSETYSTMIDSLIQDRDHKMKLFQAVNHYPCIKKKAEWGKKWITDHRSHFASRLVAFAAIEGIFFSGSFCSIYWILNLQFYFIKN